MKIFFTSCLCMALFTVITANAQHKNEDSVTTGKKSYWLLGVNYQNDNVYMGRKDSLKLPYITPSIGYYDKSGLYVTTALSYLTAAENNRIDLVTLEGGYHYLKNNFEAQAAAIKYFYNSQSTSVKSEVKGALNAYTAYDFGYIKPSLEATLNVGTASDINTTLGLEHTFYMINNKLDVTPAVFVNAGTRNYYGAYYSKRRYNALRKKKRLAGTNYYDITAQVTDATKFKLSDYEFNLPVYYTCGKFSFNVTPSFAIPVNPATLVVTVKAASGAQSTSTYPEKLSNVFYYSFGATYTFP